MSLQTSSTGFSTSVPIKPSSIKKTSKSCEKFLKKHKRIVKRGGSKFNKKMPLVIYSCNAAGLHGKIASLKSEIVNNNVAVFSIQETHFSKEGKININGYETFEAIRKKDKGGTVLGIHHSLSPILIKKYENEFGLICVEVMVAKKEI